MDHNTRTEQYKVLEASIGGDRFEDERMEIRNIIHEINIFEHLEVPYVTGRIMVVDTHNLLDNMNIRGTETFVLRLSGANRSLQDYLARTFTITSIEKATKINDFAEVYVLNFIDQAAYLSYATRFSKSYTGKGEDIITSIINSELGYDVNTKYATESVQEDLRLIVPYLTPLGACEWIRNKITTVNGSPWYVYASMYDHSLRLADLDSLLGAQEPFNKATPYIYSAATMTDVSLLDYEDDRKNRIILRVNKADIENTLEIIKLGGLAAVISATDLATGETIRHNYSVRSTLESMYRSGVIKPDHAQNVFDTRQTLNHRLKGSELVDAYPSRYFHEIKASKVYPDRVSISSAVKESELNNKVSNISLRALLNKNMIDVELWGAELFARQVTVGEQIRLYFMTSNVDNDKNEIDRVMDNNRSGDYLIYGTKHIFREGLHKVSMSVAKLVKRTN